MQEWDERVASRERRYPSTPRGEPAARRSALALMIPAIVPEGTVSAAERELQLRFGLRDGRARTLEEVGQEFNATRERIRQIETKALRHLRHPQQSKRLKEYL